MSSAGVCTVGVQLSLRAHVTGTDVVVGRQLQLGRGLERAQCAFADSLLTRQDVRCSEAGYTSGNRGGGREEWPVYVLCVGEGCFDLTWMAAQVLVNSDGGWATEISLRLFNRHGRGHWSVAFGTL